MSLQTPPTKQKGWVHPNFAYSFISHPDKYCGQVVFKLQYEELLEREKGWYSHLVNLHQDKVIPDLKVEAFIKETLPLKAVEVPNFFSQTSLMDRGGI